MANDKSERITKRSNSEPEKMNVFTIEHKQR